MGVRPLRDRVLLERVAEEEEQKVGGIIIPDTAKEKPLQGKVIAVGSGRVIVREDEILGVVEGVRELASV